MKRKLIAGILTVAMLLSLTACGSTTEVTETETTKTETTQTENATEEESSEATQSYTTKELKVNIWDNNQREGLQKIADEWTKESGVKVSIEVVDWDNYWTLLEAGASGGEMPDVFWTHSNTVQMYMENDLLLDLIS